MARAEQTLERIRTEEPVSNTSTWVRKKRFSDYTGIKQTKH